MQEGIPDALRLFLNAAQAAGQRSGETAFGSGWNCSCNSLLEIGVE
jgi:hypothetical protein